MEERELKERGRKKLKKGKIEEKEWKRKNRLGVVKKQNERENQTECTKREIIHWKQNLRKRTK